MGIHNDNWKDFFFDSNEGLGTLYDRVILERFFQRFIGEYGIKNALDCPSFGMTGFSGINSLYLARNGVEVTVCDHDPERLEWVETLWNKIGLEANFTLVSDYSRLPFDSCSFDLVWNLSALWYLKEDDLSSVMQELGRVTRKCLFVSVHNKDQLFYPVWKKVEPEFSHYVREEYSDKRVLEQVFDSTFVRLKRVEEGYFVTTPWPGVILKKDQLLKRNGTTKPTNGNGNHSLTDIAIPEYVDCVINRKTDTKVDRLMFMEKLPNPVKKRWAHLAYWVFTR